MSFASRQITLLSAALALAATGASLPALSPDSATTTVIVVRHAEKLPHAPGGDAGLSPAGVRRAQELARALSDAHITAIYSSQFMRSRLTALPLAARLKDSVRVVEADSVEVLVERVKTRHAGQTVLMVGHSDTAPPTLGLLTGRPAEEFATVDHDAMFVVTLSRSGPAKVLRLRYGEPVAPAR